MSISYFAEDIKYSVRNNEEISKFISTDSTALGSEHLTFVVENLSDYLKLNSLLQQFRVFEETEEIYELVYRGVSNKNWKLIPSLTRLGKFSPDVECELIQEFQMLRPEAFHGMTSSFEILAKMQHYGLPTRLLDFTLNPLIAMFFACHEDSSSPEVDGRIFISNCYPHYDNMPLVKFLADLSFKGISTQTNLSTMLDEYLIDLESYKSLLFGFDMYSCLFSRSAYSNQRIRNQSGIFMVFPNNINKSCDEIYNNNSLNLRNNISLISELLELTPFHLNNQFISVIIPSERKKDILNELDSVGIKLDFVFPELEYTAKRIADKYK